VQLAHPADPRRRGLPEQALDLGLLVVAELGPVGAEELDPVVLVGVVRGRHHRRQIEAVAAHQQGRARRGQHATEQGVAAAGGHPGRKRGLEHLAGLAGVAHDQDLRGLHGRDRRGGAAQRRGQLGAQELPGYAADAIGAEQLARGGAPLHDAALHGRTSAWRTAAAYGPS
jgi:hypothetical protein